MLTFQIVPLTVWLKMRTFCLEGVVVPPAICAANPSRNQRVSSPRRLAIRPQPKHGTPFAQTPANEIQVNGLWGVESKDARHVNRMCDSIILEPEEEQ